MKFKSIRADDAGESHFEVVEISDHQIPFGPPPNPSGTRADFGAVESMFAFAVPRGTSVPPHNAPQPYIAIILSGDVEVAASDGGVNLFGSGDVLFCDDLTGKGHLTKALSDSVVVFINRRLDA
jgi:quercetin dioxygenase-like cupin family protein